MKTYFKTCPYCGANLDPGETCDCLELQARKEADAEKFRSLILKLCNKIDDPRKLSWIYDHVNRFYVSGNF